MNKAQEVRKALNMSVEEAGVFFGYGINGYKGWWRLEKFGKWNPTTDRHFDMVLLLNNASNKTAINLLVHQFSGKDSSKEK